MGVILILSGKGNSCSQEQDLSWVNKLNLQVQELSKINQTEAETVVQNALESASEAKNCSSAKELVHLGEERIRQTLMINGNPKELSDSRVTETGSNDTRIDDTFPYPKLLVFVSFSMPAESLNALNAQVNRVGGKLVLRGLANGSFQQMAQKLKDLQIDIIIDPTLFEAYQVNQNPTFILRSTPTTSPEEEVPHDRLTGNVSLEYVLEQFSAHGETRLQALEMLKILRREP
ncbi:MAG: type-F conjugative transfer system pilin assembly protein TrbC [Bacillota bacterium]|nr:type-F conjugative transfer system pilin assembly protein TrbC [Bacillota bacterium]